MNMSQLLHGSATAMCKCTHGLPARSQRAGSWHASLEVLLKGATCVCSCSTYIPSASSGWGTACFAHCMLGASAVPHDRPTEGKGEHASLHTMPLEPTTGGVIAVPHLGQGEALHLELQDLAVDLVQVRRLGGDLHLQLGRALIHQVDCLHASTQKYYASLAVLSLLDPARPEAPWHSLGLVMFPQTW